MCRWSLIFWNKVRCPGGHQPVVPPQLPLFPLNGRSRPFHPVTISHPPLLASLTDAHVLLSSHRQTLPLPSLAHADILSLAPPAPSFSDEHKKRNVTLALGWHQQQIWQERDIWQVSNLSGPIHHSNINFHVYRFMSGHETKFPF